MTLALFMLVGCLGGSKGAISKEEGTRTVILHDVKYELPFSFDDLQEDGWEMSSFMSIDSLKPMGKDTTFLKNGSDEIYVTVVNPTDKESSKDLMVTELHIDLDSYASNEYEVYGQVKLDDVYEDIQKNFKDLNLKSYDKDYGRVSFGTESEEFALDLSNRGKINGFRFSNYGEWDEYDFRYSFSDDEEEDDKDLDFDFTNDYSWILLSEEEVKEKAEKNRTDHPLTDLESFVDNKFGPYKVEGTIQSRLAVDDTYAYTVKDSSGALILVDASEIDDYLDGEELANGTAVVMYLSSVQAIEESLALNTGVAMILLVLEVNDTTYSFYSK